MEGDTVKLCPMSFNKAKPTECLEDRCAWWLDCWACAVTVLADCAAMNTSEDIEDDPDE
jgi:hypothetical protein